MPLDPSRTVEELRELRELTGDENGAQRVAWTPTWVEAKEWLAGMLEALPLEYEVDAAGNQWWTLRGDSERAVLLGGHIDSVPNGGWLDGCLNVVAAVEVLRRIAEQGTFRLAPEGEPLVAGGVDRLLRPRVADLAAQPLSRALPGLGPRDPLSAVAVPGQLLELAKLIDGSAGLQRHAATLTW